ncbi:MAG TPA: mercuric reductase [Gemmatimonadaceae bacterium]|nr:mercuric reductase [Gemmatimonadaceae bacterium]
MLATDRWDSKLIAEVHPPGWVNPVPAKRYDLVVIGAGTGGLVSAAGAAGLGARVALIERHLMGGDCLNVGCLPSKGLISAARAWHAARHAAADFSGPAVAHDAQGDFTAMMDRMRRIRAEMSPIDGAARFRDLGVDVFLGDGSFTDAETIQVGSAILKFRRAVIATGARAAAPKIAGLESVKYFTNESIFDLTTLPRHLVVVGAGPIGCEMAQCFARFGSQVTLIDKGARVLPRDDAEAALVVQQALIDDGVTILSSTAIAGVSQQGDGITVRSTRDGVESAVTCDALLIAIGRAPNVEGLQLEKGGVAYTPKGVTVDDRLQTSNPDVYAVGDICSPLQFTHAADFQARMVIQNALFFGRGKASNLVTPWATYTSPELAQVGHTAESAAKDGVKVTTFTVPLHDVDRARLEGDTRGFCRVHVREGSDTIVGATIVAPNAGDMISEVTLAMTNGLGLGAIGKTMHPYPTQAEVLRKVADAWRRTKLTPAVKNLFTRYFPLFR